MESERIRRIKILMEKLQKKSIYLYGAGIRGGVALKNLKTLGFEQNVLGFIDDNINKRQYLGRNVCLPEKAKCNENANVVFIIATYAVKKMACRLMENGILSENIFFSPELLIDDIEVETFRENKTKIKQVYDSLSDCLSKYIYQSIFEIYLNGNIGILSITSGGEQYFPIKGTSDEIEEFCLSENESFIDCGAYDGDTIRSFRDRTNNKYKKIWAFEPDASNFLRLFDYIKEEDARVQLFQAGVYNEDKVMCFESGNGTTSSLRQAGGGNVTVNQLDSVIDEPVTFIKMDIEGAEKEALFGAKRIIFEYKPKLAICIYHKIEDLWEIPLLIKELNPNYHIYIRNYKDRLDEVVCYAIHHTVS